MDSTEKAILSLQVPEGVTKLTLQTIGEGERMRDVYGPVVLDWLQRQSLWKMLNEESRRSVKSFVRDFMEKSQFIIDPRLFEICLQHQLRAIYLLQKF